MNLRRGHLTAVRAPRSNHIAQKKGIDACIHALRLEHEIRAQVSFTAEADLLQNALRRDVVRYDEGLDTGESGLGHGPTSEKSDCVPSTRC